MSLLEVRSLARSLVDRLGTKVLGQAHVIEEVVITVLAGSHALLTGAPGVAKTTLVRHLASSLGCGYKRIQFTPDLTPFDVLGGDTIQFDERNPDIKRLVFTQGPIFSPFVLADEINRASPRTQSALLEAMQERQVSMAGISRALPHPFYVFATQNPIENEGTFPLPEAQLDRFLLNIEVDYPEFDAEVRVATLSAAVETLSPLEGAVELFSARPQLEQFPMSHALVEAAVRIVRNTRPKDSGLTVAKEFLEFGASPRASQSLVIAAKARALLEGADEVGPEHLLAVGPAVLRHRCIPSFQALSRKRDTTSIVKEVLAETVL